MTSDSAIDNGAAIQIENLTKRYGDKTAVENLDLVIPPGEIFAFLGPNGAGKTTTIKVMAGLLKPSEGRVLIGGHDIQREHLHAKAVLGYIPDHPYLYEKLTGRDFVHFVGDLHAIPGSERDARMLEWFTLFDLVSAADQLIENYSHGMRQKLVFTAAMLHRPRVIVVDEPMVGLDPRSSRIFKRLLRREADASARGRRGSRHPHRDHREGQPHFPRHARRAPRQDTRRRHARRSLPRAHRRARSRGVVSGRQSPSS
jgi:ABC-2 type transport system ATP-binding protein